MSQLAFAPAGVAPTHHGGGKELTWTDTKGSGRTVQSNVFARLQALFPGSNSTSPRASTISAPVHAEPHPPPSAPTRPPPRFLKIRVISWNMHDSLPKGNLEDLLGVVPPYVPCPEGETDRFRIPNMTADDCHPYHLVVVAGQECPTVSGIPMGLGASFRHKEKDKHKEGEKSARKGKGKEGKDRDEDLEHEGSPPNGPSIPTADVNSSNNTHGPASGWSWILEEWFCHGRGQRSGNAGSSSASELYKSQATSASADSERHTFSPQRSSTPVQSEFDAKLGKEKDKKKEKEWKRRSYRGDKVPTGPYELLVKERLMGIYVAVFIYKDLKPLVRGMSRSAVTTGLIGGRVGNKGGVGISVNLDGTTLLFVNAHLAAHEERIMSRVANMAKIKSELQVNDFLSQDDPRVMAEDLTDRFDHTFVFGDLNFRLDVTRLHADWLISRQDYDQALAFDQLRTLMKDGKAFVGFHEAPIHFPPTFKYDVVRSLKRDRSHLNRDLLKTRGNKRWVSRRSNPSLSEVKEKDTMDTTLPLEADEWPERSGGTSFEIEDSGSFVSLANTSTSGQTRLTANDDTDDTDGFFVRSRSSKSNYGEGGEGGAGIMAKKMLIAKAALKAKAKWMALLHSSDSMSSKPSGPRKVSKYKPRNRYAASSSPQNHRAAELDGSSSALKAASAIELGQPHAPSLSELQRTSSKKSSKSLKSVSMLPGKASETSGQESEGGMYDTSSKQRVPSWCDRILWKTTIHMEPDSEEDSFSEIRGGLGPRVRQFFTHALKPLSTRGRTSSVSSITSLPAVEFAPPLHSKDLSRPQTVMSDSQPLLFPSLEQEENGPVPSKVRSFTNIVNPRHRSNRKARAPELLKSKSIEPATTTPLVSHSLDKQRVRSNSATLAISGPIVTAPASLPFNVEPKESEGPPVPPKDLMIRQHASSSRGWRFFPFFGRDGNLNQDTNVASPTLISSPLPPVHRPRKGEVVALGYGSLDDQAMRQLEGRSDHRPVIGSYAIYI